MFLVLVKLASSGFSPCKKIILILTQTFPKVLVLVPTVSLPPLSDDVDDEETYHPFHVVA